MNREDIYNKNIQFVLSKLDEVNKVKDVVAEIASGLVDFTLDGGIAQQDFYKITSLLTSQQRSLMWESYFMQKYGFSKISPQEDRGDMMKGGKYYEYKASGFNKDKSLHIVQIRLWQQCDYIIQYIEQEKVYSFSLKKEQMMRETKLCKASSAHGTAESNKRNKNVEVRMSIQKESDDWKRWVQQYSYTP